MGVGELNLPEIPFGRRGNPNARKAIGAQKIEQVLRIPRVGLLLAHHRSANRRRIAHLQLVPTTTQQPFKPLRRTGGLQADARPRGKDS